MAGTTHVTSAPDRSSGFFWILTVAYAALLVYGTLFPLTHWHAPYSSPWKLMFSQGIAQRSFTDVVTNGLVYMPLGLLIVLAAGRRGHVLAATLLAVIVGGLLSLSLEYLQAYLPNRVPSALDLALNTLSSLAGALLGAALGSQSQLGRWLRDLRQQYVEPGAVASLGLSILALWALSQLTPLVPSIDIGNLKQGLKPLWYTLRDLSQFNVAQFGVYALAIAGLGLVSRTVLRGSARGQLVLFAAFVAVVLLLKVPVLSRQLSLEAVAGMTVGLVLLMLLGRGSTRAMPLAAATAVLGAVIVESLRPGSAGAGGGGSFNWVPFRGQLGNELTGLADILTGAWPFLALSYLAVSSRPKHRVLVATLGGLALVMLVFALEWQQRHLPGRYADTTDAVIALIAWLVPWLHPAVRAAASAPVEAPTQSERRPRRRRRRSKLVWTPVVLIATLVVSFAGWQLMHPALERPLDESTWHTLPGPNELPPVALPGFRYQHPRLPAPSASDIQRLAEEDERFFRTLDNRAKQGKGRLDKVILAAYVRPGSQDLHVLHQKLMALEFSWRGHGQVKPIAVAYDWLYHQWTPAQRAQLATKLADGAEFIIYTTREEKRLSPYNVFLYNSPFQALMAAAIALYGDDQRGDAVMRFTYDYWKNRVLPVWRQVMGQNGGWHEGGEYVRLGIGQAIYQVPAMWRKATGEDLFRTEPAIRGFLDFLIYRTRPDGTYFRWGDAAVFWRDIPDRLALAMEYKHKPGYSFRRPRVQLGPTSWPWGPLPEPELYAPDALETLPWFKFFDGLGLVVARSDWSTDATYVTFKAGDNYWSHSHLDQGAFTVYKGGPLAIDSGLYGPRYGSDHHMNYTYQTIAHNTVTVTDPVDTQPAPSRKRRPPRPIANDGGQRRIGSGWGIEAAPLDLAEWIEKREIYHTGTMETVFSDDDILVAVGDVTPAYTNSYSGRGTFSHRTRRVEQFQRTFGYDRVDDVLVVFDQVHATEAQFRKRWLLHSMEEPQLAGDTFKVTYRPVPQLSHAGGHLIGHVLLPKQPNILKLGGPGFEFFVDSKNYSEDGEVYEEIARHVEPRDTGRPEPGAWRIEVSPGIEAKNDDFLVVLLPAAFGVEPPHAVRLLEDGQQIGAEIVGPTRTTRWWFSKDTGALRLEVDSPSSQRTYTVQAGVPNASGRHEPFVRGSRHLTD